MKSGYCMQCKNCRKKFEYDKGYNLITKKYWACYCLPYWGKDVEKIKICPKKEYGENAGSLKTICKVNTEV